MSQLFTELQTKTPPEGKYAPDLKIMTSDEVPIAQAVLKGEEARTLAVEPEIETSEDNRFTTTTIEAPNSERITVLERLAQAEKQAEQDLRDFQPLTEADKEAKQAVLSESNANRYNSALDEFKASHPDFDAVMAQVADADITEAKRQALMEAGPQAVYELAKNPDAAQRFVSMSDSEADAFLKGNRTTSSAEAESQYDVLLREAAEAGENVEQLAETLQTQIFPTSEEGYAKLAVLAYALGQVSNRRAVVLALAKDSTALSRIATAETPEALAKEVHKLSARLKFGQSAAQTVTATRSRLGPTVPVSGTVKSTVPPDEMSYADFREWRNRTKRKY
jgi:hypothetical protein